jgi:hypothetical protein
MILNTNNLPWCISKELRTIINYNISDYSRACVLNCSDPEYSIESAENYPVKIAIDTDGTLIMIASYLYLDGPPFRNIVIKLNFDFVAHQVRFFDKVVSLSGEYKKFSIWEKSFVEAYRLGKYKVKVSPICEV